MPLDLESVGNERTRWVQLEGHLSEVSILVRSVTPADARRFYNRLQSAGVVRPNRDNPLDVAPGREAQFFQAMAEQYVVDWKGIVAKRGDTDDAPYSAKEMGKILGGFSRAFSALLAAIAEEDAFFEKPPERPTSN